ncbi:MAG: flagellar hook-length control protein FliK [Planctomycetota bacterium]
MIDPIAAILPVDTAAKAPSKATTTASGAAPGESEAQDFHDRLRDEFRPFAPKTQSNQSRFIRETDAATQNLRSKTGARNDTRADPNPGRPDAADRSATPERLDSQETPPDNEAATPVDQDLNDQATNPAGREIEASDDSENDVTVDSESSAGADAESEAQGVTEAAVDAAQTTANVQANAAASPAITNANVSVSEEPAASSSAGVATRNAAANAATTDASGPVVTTPVTPSQTGTGTAGDDPSSQTGNPSTNAADPANARAANTAAAPAFSAAAPNAALDAPGSNLQTNLPATTPSNSAATPTTTPTGDSPDALNEARLARGLRSALNQQGGSVTLRLTPPEMGTVRIQMQLQGTQVTAQFHAETDAAQRLLTQQLGQLRTALEGQGLTVDRIGVQSMSAGNASGFNGSNLQQQGQAFGQNQEGANANPDGRSRGSFQSSDGDANADHGTNDVPPDDFAELVDEITDLDTGSDPI